MKKTQPHKFKKIAGVLPMSEKTKMVCESRTKKLFIRQKETKNGSHTWRESHPLKDDGKWNAKLDCLGINESQFNELFYLSDEDDIGNNKHINNELRDLQKFYSRLQTIANTRKYSENKNSSGDSKAKIDFGLAIPPLITYVEELLRKKVINDNSIIEDYHEYIYQCLGHINIVLKKEIAPALVIEYNLNHEQGRLKGKNEVQKFQDFIIRVTSSADWIVIFFNKYPVLLYTVWQLVKNAVKFYSLVTKRIIEDYNSLIENKFIKSHDKIVYVEWPLGDLHCKCEATSLINLRSGNKILYKSREAKNEIIFSQFIAWMNDNGYKLSFKDVEILSKQKYSWTKFIQHRPCSNRGEIERFFERQGAYLAILYFLGGNDFISDNVIACGEYPVLIDLECLLSPNMPFSESNYVDSSIAGKKFYDSVIRVGILPQWAAGDTNTPGLNLGGISRLDKENVVNRLSWIFDNEGKIYQKVIKTKVQSLNTHLPKLDDTPQEIKDYVNFFINGFSYSYRFIEENKIKLLSENSILKKFKGAEARILFRHTNIYERIANEARHPDYLIDSLKKDHLLDYYWASYDSTEMPGTIINSEIRQAWDCNIPFFYTYNNTKDVWDAYNVQICHSFFERTGFECLEKRIENACEKDLIFQISIINRSLSIFEDYSPLENIEIPKFSITTEKNNIYKDDLIKTAEKIANEILSNAFEDNNDINWIDIAVGKHGEWQQTVKPFGIYDGTEGIGLFFLYLYKLTSNEKYKNIVFKILNRSLSEFEKNISTGFKGDINHSPMLFPSSSLFLLNHAHSCFPNEWDIDRYITMFSKWLESNLQYDYHFDFNNGICGTIQMLLDFYLKTKDEEVKRIIVLCGEHLLKNAKDIDNGIAWEGPKLKFLGGFAHGASSFSWTLVRMGKELNMDKFVEGGIKALNYDQSFYDTEIQAWKDGRHHDKISSSAWCHGSAGIVLSRLLLTNYIDNPKLEIELKSGLNHIIDYGFSLSHCLCHGQMGNIEILFALARYTKDKNLEYSVNNHLKLLINNFDSGGKWKCGMNERNIDLYGLFMGITGIGYAMLRFADWENIPSVLTMEGPDRKNYILH